MKNTIKLKVFDNAKNENSDPTTGTEIIETVFRVIQNEKLLEAVKKSIVSLIERVEDREIEWLENRIKEIIDTLPKASDLHGFFIGDHYYTFEA